MGDIKYQNAIDHGAQRAKNAADPTSATDLATKQYVDNAIAGLNWKQNVRAASTANVTVASALINGSSMDGVTLATGDRVLLKNQTAGAENGIYLVVSSGAASRSTDADTSAEVKNLAVRVSEGTTLADTIWQMVTDTVTLGTTALTFTQFTAGAIYTAGNGLQLSGGAFSVVADTGISVSGSGVAVNFAVVVRKFATAIGDGSTLDITVTHNLGTKDVELQVRDSTTGDQIYVSNDTPTTNTLTMHFVTAPTTNQYRAIVQG